MAESSVSLRDLLTPTAKEILNRGKVVKDRDRSLWLLAQDLFGWRNWLEARDVPFTGDPEQIFSEAGRKLRFSDDEASQILKMARVKRAIPSCVYKGNEDEEVGYNGDIPAWAHVFNLEPSLAGYCPPEIKETVASHIDQYRQFVPKEPKQKPKGISLQNELGQNNKTPGTDKKAQTAVESQIDKKHLDATFAKLGREIARFGEVKDGHREVDGKVRYRILINLNSNTMRIYDKDRGEEPILIDADGQIDHASSKVKPADVERFQAIVRKLRVYESTKESQTEL